MKLHEIPEGSKLKLSISIGSGKPKDTFVTFNHIDGMYSHITTDKGEVLHLGVMEEMEKVDDYYIIK